MNVEGTAVVITCSTRAATGIYPDRSGPIIVEALRAWGLVVGDVVVVPDGPDVEVALRAAISTGAALVVNRLVPGIAEAIRAAGVQAGIPSAMLSRGVSGVAGRTLVVNLPGSTGGVRDGLGVLQPVVAHALSQVQGGDH
jgi:molybdopterin biosynthesis enzyme MoaB